MNDEVEDLPPQPTKEPHIKSKKVNKTYEELGYPPEDGERFTVGLEKPNEPKVFLDFLETDDFAKARTACIDACCDEEREAIVWDRKLREIVFRYKPVNQEVAQNDTATPSKPTKGRRNSRKTSK